MPALIVVSSLLLMAFVANSLGFVSPDSLNYLRLAESINNGNGFRADVIKQKITEAIKKKLPVSVAVLN